MMLETTRFGTIEVSERKKVNFAEGLIGFSHSESFVILNKGENQSFQWLQSMDDGSLAFIITKPFSFLGSYKPPIDKNDLEYLQVSSIDALEVYSIVVVPKNPQEMTANLLAPVLINSKIQKGRQVILHGSQYLVKHPIIPPALRTKATSYEQAKAS